MLCVAFVFYFCGTSSANDSDSRGCVVVVCGHLQQAEVIEGQLHQLDQLIVGVLEPIKRD